MSRKLRLAKFKELALADPFFDSLKAAYAEFPDWFKSKADEDVYIVEDGRQLSGMVYLKCESGPVLDVEPNLPACNWLKVGTLKIEARGTKLGERIIKKIFDTALQENADGIYITIFDIHESLIRLFKRYGFRDAGEKETTNGIERVLSRSLTNTIGSQLDDYPLIHLSGRKAWLLAVYPEYHSRLLPDSILNNEPREIVQDVSHTNTIHKVYIGRLPLTRMSRGDIVILYRTTDHKGPAYFRSVATSVCVVEEIRKKNDFFSAEEFLRYCRPHSVFTKDELLDQFGSWARLYVAKMTYNAAFRKRITRGRLLDDAQVSEHPRWDLRELSLTQLRTILKMGGINDRLIVD